MRLRVTILSALLVFLACDDDPAAPPAQPNAVFEVTRLNDMTVLVDASNSDPGDANTKMWLRWDWEGDGVWDTDWSEEKTATHEYETEGPQTITLEVQAPWRRLAQATQRVTVAQLSTPGLVVEGLAKAYRHMDPGLLEVLLANDAERSAEYLFFLSDPTDMGETQWGYEEEMRIHRRMFDPAHLAPGDPPVPSELWLQGVTVYLTQAEPFAERSDMYTTSEPPGPLDPSIWRALEARYTTYLYLDFDAIDYRIEGFADFVVVEDLTKDAGEHGKFRLWIWEDLGMFVPKPAGAASDGATWSRLKALFR